MREREKCAAKMFPYRLLPNSDWVTVSRDTELYWPTRSAHTRAGHVDYMDDLRTLTPYLKKQAQRFSGIDAVLDKAVEEYGLVCGQEDTVGDFLKEFKRTKDGLPPDLVEHLQSYVEYRELLYYHVCLKHTIAEWRKQQRRLKILERMHLAWTTRFFRHLRASCVIRCTCELSHEDFPPISNRTPVEEAAGQEGSGQQARTENRKEIPTPDAVPPPLLICPITLELLEDPVVAADGFTYSRTAIGRWLRCRRRTSPMTNAPLAHKYLTPNNAIRSMVLAWRATLGEVPKSLFYLDGSATKSQA